VFSRFFGATPKPARPSVSFRQQVVPIIALGSVTALMALPLANPQIEQAFADYSHESNRPESASIVVAGEAGQVIRDGQWTVSRSAVATAPVTGIPDPGTTQALARELLVASGHNDTEYRCLHALWMRESRWNPFAENPSSGAYGIPQALPGSKMASAGADWATNPETQIRWGLGYIDARYGSPCAAWEHSEEHNWY